ncbi:MAG: hypothetical protein ABH863_02005 [Candidatus Micrarchaeota archaeon]
MKKNARKTASRKVRAAAPLPAIPEGKSVQSLETGILSLLSFLGHSFKRGSISDDLYDRERAAALRNLDTLRALEPQDAADDFDDDAPQEKKKQAMLKNKHDIENLLSFLEDSYNEGAVTEKSYRELRGENVKKLSRINKLLSGASGESTTLEAPSEVYDKFREEGDEEKELDEELGPAQRMQFRAKDFAVASLPELDYEPEVKPISFSEKLEGISRQKARGSPYGKATEADEILEALKLGPRKSGTVEIDETGGSEDESGRDDPAPQYDDGGYGGSNLPYGEPGTDDIMQSLGIGKKGRRPTEASDNPDSAPSFGAREGGVRTGALLGKLSGIVGKFKKQGGSGGAPVAEAAQANSSEGAAVSDQPSWADKLPEEMNPQELEEYNKSRAQQESEAQGTAPQAEESAPILQAKGGAQEGGSVSSVEVERLVLELEKMKVKLETVENTRTVVEERIEHIMENIGELRTMLFEKESSGKEQEAKLDKFVEMVSDLEPSRFAKELDKRDRLIGEHAMKVEKLETMTGDMVQTVSRVRTMLEAIGSLKNIATVSKDIADRSSKIDNTVSKVERLADETGRVYVELNRKLNEFTLYRGKQDIMAESLKELVGMTESMSGKLDNYATREDLNDLKRGLEDTHEKFNEMQAKIELASEGEELPDHIKDLQEEKEGLEQILESNEEEFLEGKIKEPEYKKMKDIHVRKLQVVRQKLRDELSKMRKEKVQQTQRSQDITREMRANSPKEGVGGDDQTAQEANADDQMEKNTSEEDAPSTPLAKPAAQKSIPPKKAQLQSPGVRKAPTMKKSLPSKEMMPTTSGMDLEEHEIEGEADEQALAQAETTAQLEDEQQENQEDGEEPTDAFEENPDPTPPMKGEVIGKKATFAKPKALPIGKGGPPQKSGSPMKTAKIPVFKKAVLAPPTLSLKTENPLPSKGGMRIYDIIKGTSEGKRVSFSAQATTIKKGSSQCLIKLEDDSGVIYGTYGAPLKGALALQGMVAKDPQGVPYVKIAKAG